MTITHTQPTAIHVGADDLPFVDIGDGSKLKVLQVKETEGLWIVQNVFQNGYCMPTHKHTGPVWGYTVSGAWKYKEYEYVNRAGSFLYEPASSVHTLECIEDDQRSVIDAGGILEAYYMLCEAEGLPRPAVLTD